MQQEDVPLAMTLEMKMNSKDFQLVKCLENHMDIPNEKNATDEEIIKGAYTAFIKLILRFAHGSDNASTELNEFINRMLYVYREIDEENKRSDTASITIQD